MEQEDKQGVCEAQDSEDEGMGSDFENSEDRERDPEETGMGSNPQDALKRQDHPEPKMGSNPQDAALGRDPEERELVSDICPGEDEAGISLEVVPLTIISSSSRVRTRGGIRCGRVL